MLCSIFTNFGNQPLVISAPTWDSHIPISQTQKAIGGPILPYLHEQLKQKSTYEYNFSSMYTSQLFCFITKQIQNKIIQKYEKCHTKLCLTVQMLKWARLLFWFWFCRFGISYTVKTYDKTTAIGFSLYIKKLRKYREKRESFWHL